MKSLRVGAAASRERLQHQVPLGEVVPPQQETWVVEHLLSEELKEEPLPIVVTEVEHQPGIPVVRTKLLLGRDPDQRLLLGVVLETRHLHGVQRRDLGHLRGEQRRVVVLLHGEVEMEGEHRDEEKRLFGHLVRHGMIRPKLRLPVSGMHLPQEYYPSRSNADNLRLTQRKHQHILPPTLMRTMILRLLQEHNLLRRPGLQEHIMHERLDQRMPPLHLAMLQQVHSLPWHIFIASFYNCNQK